MRSTRSRRASKQTLLVIELLLANPRGWQYGYTISQQTGLASGSLYPILIRLAKDKWLETKWAEPEEEGRPPRHLYRLTAPGARWAREVLNEVALSTPNMRSLPERAR